MAPFSLPRTTTMRKGVSLVTAKSAAAAEQREQQVRLSWKRRIAKKDETEERLDYY